MRHEGGCLCGAVRYAVEGVPLRTSVCHCRFCQRRTGTAFAILPFFEAVQVTDLRGTPATYRHVSDVSGRWLEVAFCARCGTNTSIRVERGPDARGIAGATFDAPDWFRIDRHIWTRSKLPWVVLPVGC